MTISSPARSELWAASARDAFEALEWAQFDAGAKPCPTHDCMLFAPPNSDRCEICAADAEKRAVLVSARSGIFGYAFEEDVPLHRDTNTAAHIRRRIVVSLNVGAEMHEGLGIYGAPVWRATARALMAPARVHEQELWKRLNDLLESEPPASEPGGATSGERLAADLIDISLEALVAHLPAAEPGRRTPFVIAGNVVHWLHWQVAGALRTGGWGDTDSLSVAALVGWTNALTTT